MRLSSVDLLCAGAFHRCAVSTSAASEVRCTRQPLAGRQRCLGEIDLVGDRVSFAEIPAVDESLAVIAQRGLGEAGDLFGKREGNGKRGAVINNAVDESDGKRLICAYLPAGQNNLHRAAMAHDAGKPNTPEVAGRHAEAAIVHAEE